MLKNNLNKEKILSLILENEVKNSYLSYAMSVIISRALPNCCDGLKPVQRRILYAMYNNNNFYNRPYKKSARVVGEVMGKYHPHGDQAIYSALVRMTQSFLLIVPLINGQGNFGSIDGDSPAQMRYTEIRLSKAAQYLLDDIDKNTVDFKNNYDNSNNEPKVLPAKFPNLLINGSSGIAVGMATNIPTHNILEVIEACCLIISNPNLNNEKFVNLVPAPDFPTGGEIINPKGTKYTIIRGKGNVIIRSIIKILEKKSVIIIKEIPYQVNKSDILATINDSIKKKKIEGILEVRDESNKLGVHVVIELKKNVNVEFLINNLYQNTQLQNTFAINMLALHNGIPKTMNVRKVLSSFIIFRVNILKRKIVYLLNQARIRAHLIIGLSIAIFNINNIIALMKFSNDIYMAQLYLLKKKWNSPENIEHFINVISDHRNIIINRFCFFTKNQVKFILEMKLHNLTSLEKNKIENELEEITQVIKNYLSLLLSEDQIFFLMKEELKDIKNNIFLYRKTKIKRYINKVKNKNLSLKEKVIIFLTKKGFIQKSPLNIYKSQKKGSKGKICSTIYENDIIKNIVVTDSNANLIFFSSLGLVFKLITYKIPTNDNKLKRESLINLISINKNDIINNIIPILANKKYKSKLNIIFITKYGMIKRNNVNDFKNIKYNGKVAIKLNNNDKLIDSTFCNNINHIFLSTKLGNAIRFPLLLLRVSKSRLSMGIKVIKLTKDDDIISISNLKNIKLKYLVIKNRLNIKTDYKKKIYIKKKNEKNKQFVITITDSGYGKITPNYEYITTNRNNKGFVNMSINKYDERIISSFDIYNKDQIILITNIGNIIRIKIKNIRITNRKTKGMKIINLKYKEKVVSISKVFIKNKIFI